MSTQDYTSVPSDVHMTTNEGTGDRWDDTGPIIGELRERTAIAIKLRDVFIDNNLRPSQRIFCIGTSVILCSILFIIFIYLLLGFNQVMHDITVQEQQQNQGLHMIPDLGTNISNSILNLIGDNVAKGRYIEIIRDYLEAYKKEQLSRKNFTKECSPLEKPPHAWCHFPLKIFEEAGCTENNRYGYDSGEPCLLFELRLETSWTPKFQTYEHRPNVTDLLLSCNVYDFPKREESTNVKYIPEFIGSHTCGAFPLNKIPSRAISDTTGRDVADENGETLYDQPPLVMVKLRLSKSIHTTVRCYVEKRSAQYADVSNIAEMPGNRFVQFDILYRARKWKDWRNSLVAAESSHNTW
ncbi:unnamed protein product [Cylicocyclus nassatus]|uniref:Uncharacterized protein n=1 Tax=Cylicocyclus nassatus TaxID=53992 RepID=A0AA36H6Q4_CYLNA|nr:unnamed protein product [Cylicocyclus nassatus]